MAEYQVFREMFKKDETAAILELVYWSLHRGSSSITRRKVRRLVKKYPAVLLALVNLICDISLPKTKSGEESGEDDSLAGGELEQNIKTVYRLTSKMFGWTPQAIGDMSPAQIFLYMTGWPDGTGIVKMDDAQYASFMGRKGMN